MINIFEVKLKHKNLKLKKETKILNNETWVTGDTKIKYN